MPVPGPRPLPLVRRGHRSALRRRRLPVEQRGIHVRVRGRAAKFGTEAGPSSRGAGVLVACTSELTMPIEPLGLTLGLTWTPQQHPFHHPVRSVPRPDHNKPLVRLEIGTRRMKTAFHLGCGAAFDSPPRAAREAEDKIDLDPVRRPIIVRLGSVRRDGHHRLDDEAFPALPDDR